MQHSAHTHRCGKTLLWLLVGLLIGGAAGAAAVYVLKKGKAGIPGGPRLGNAEEVSMIPADSLGFVHIRARDLWKTEELADFRKVLDGRPEASNPQRRLRPRPPRSTTPRCGTGGSYPERKSCRPPRDRGLPITPPEPRRRRHPQLHAAFDSAGQVRVFPECHRQGRTARISSSMSRRASASTSQTAGSWWSAWPRGGGVRRADPDVSLPTALKAPIALASEGSRHIVARSTQSFNIGPAALVGELRDAPPNSLNSPRRLPILKADASHLPSASPVRRLELRDYYKNDGMQRPLKKHQDR